MTRAPVLILAIGLEISSEMIDAGEAHHRREDEQAREIEALCGDEPIQPQYADDDRDDHQDGDVGQQKQEDPLHRGLCSPLADR